MTRVLVAYATRHNSTAEIAYTIGETLRRIGQIQVDVEQVENVEDISPYQVVVLGSAVYMGQWQPVAVDFLKAHERELAQRSVWLFSSGPVGEGDPRTLLNGWVFPESLQPIADRIQPRDIALFHGKLDSSWLNIFERAAVKFVGATAGDSRDWDTIQQWAAAISEALVAT